MGSIGKGVKMSCACINKNRDIAYKNARNILEKIVKAVLLEYYRNASNSFKDFDYEVAIQRIKTETINQLSNKRELIGMIGQDQINRMACVRTTTLDHFMREINQKAFEDFNKTQVNDDIGDR